MTQGSVRGRCCPSAQVFKNWITKYRLVSVTTDLWENIWLRKIKEKKCLRSEKTTPGDSNNLDETTINPVMTVRKIINVGFNEF